MKKIKTPLKIRNSKGEIHFICPYIDKIDEILSNNNINIDDLFTIRRHFEIIKEIAKVWQKEIGYDMCPMHNDHEYASLQIAKPYNYQAVLKNIRLKLKLGNFTEEILDEILNCYI